MPTLDEVHSKMRAYLDGTLELEELMDWVGDNSSVASSHAIRRKIGPNSYQITGYDAPEWRILSDLRMMDCEMTCSGCLRTEEMLRQDFISILDGKRPTAFWAEDQPETNDVKP